MPELLPFRLRRKRFLSRPHWISFMPQGFEPNPLYHGEFSWFGHMYHPSPAPLPEYAEADYPQSRVVNLPVDRLR